MTTPIVQHTATKEFLDQQPKPGKTVLDFGCGDCFASREFVARGAKLVVAFDLNPNPGMTGVPSNVMVLVGNDSRPGPSRQFDIVWCHHVLEHQEQPIEFLRMLRGYLGERGELWLTVPHGTGNDVYSPGHLLNYNLPTLVEHLRLAGFDTLTGCYTRQRGHVRTVVKRWETGGLSPYPAAMEHMLKTQGRCPGDQLIGINWPRA